LTQSVTALRSSGYGDKDLLDRRVLVRAVVAAEARQLDLQSSVRKLAQDKITHMPGQGIQTLKA